MKSIKTLFVLSAYFLSLCATVIADTRAVRVGVSAPLSGDLIEYGTAVKNGIELARAEEPKSFSGVEFIYEDNQYEAAKAVTAFNKLVSLDKVDLIFNWGEPTLGAIAPIAEKQKVPVLAMSLDRMPAQGKSYVLLTINYAEQYAQKLMEYLRTKGVKKIAIVQTEDPFLDSMVEGLRKNLKTGESVEVFASFKPGDTDFKTQITKLRQADFDIIGVYLFTGQVSVFFRQAASMSLKKNFFGTDFFESHNEIAQAQGAMDGAVYPNLQVPGNFKTKYFKKFGNDAQITYAYNAYEFAKTTAQVFPQTEATPKADQIITRYLKVQRNEAFVTDKTPEGANYFKFPLTMRMVKGDSFVDIN